MWNVLKNKNYSLKRKWHLILAKLGIVEHQGKYVVPTSRVYVYERELDDDRWIDWEAVDGIQIWPYPKKVVRFELMHDSLYREYVKTKCGYEAY